MNSISRFVAIGGLFSAFALVGQARIERVVEKSFPVSGVGTLRVETHGGEIRVSPSNDSVVHITAKEKIKANTEAEADEWLKKLVRLRLGVGLDFLLRSDVH